MAETTIVGPVWQIIRKDQDDCGLCAVQDALTSLKAIAPDIQGDAFTINVRLETPDVWKVEVFRA